MKDIIITDNKKFDEIIKNFYKDWIDNIQIISDFDRTLTYSRVNWEKHPSLISVLRREKILWEEYSKEAYNLYNYYEPIERNPKISMEQKKSEMLNWREKHLKLLVKSWLKKQDIEKVVSSWIITLRDWVDKLLGLTKKQSIPFTIISASGLWYDSIYLYLKNKNLMYDNISIISNNFLWDEDWNIIWHWDKIIHSFNKDEWVLNNNKEISKKIKDKKNIILLGDTIWDIGMTSGLEYDNLLKIGFLNEDIEENLSLYKENFDVIILNDWDFSFVNEVILSL